MQVVLEAGRSDIELEAVGEDQDGGAELAMTAHPAGVLAGEGFSEGDAVPLNHHVDIEVRLVQSPDKLPLAFGAKGVGELCLIPTSPACSHAYYRLDGQFRTSLPLKNTFYKKENT
jgi:hypothetical protein